MLKTIKEYIDRLHLLNASDKILVGLSGGPDSVALLLAMIRLGYSCIALHCNFHLRGDESIRDEKFAKQIAVKLNVPFYKIDFDTTAYAEQNHISIEMAARELRYEWFEKMRVQLNAQLIAVAHHRDDSIETLILNMVRGSGIRGLVGIRPRNNNIVRPLLCVSRQEILQWLKKENYTYVTDSTNLSDEYTRNFIRLNILPMLEKINPSVRQTLMRTTEHLSAAETIYNSVIEKAEKELWTNNQLSIEKLIQYPSPETILYELLLPYNFNRHVVQDVFRSLSGESGRVFYSNTHRLIKDRNFLIISELKENEQESFSYSVVDGKWEKPFPFSFQIVTNKKDFKFEVSRNTAYFDLDKLENNLVFRHWQKGDWFIPFGMKGRKKISDYFSDHKYTLQQKENAWLLCSENSVIWLASERSDNRFRVQPETKLILIVKKHEK